MSQLVRLEGKHTVQGAHFAPVIAKLETHLCIVEEPVVVLPALEIAHSHLFTARHLNNNNFSSSRSIMITSSD